MGRPPLSVGTFGRIRFYATGAGWRARVLCRDLDGTVRQVERTRRSRAGAERALKDALRDRLRGTAAGVIERGRIGPGTRLSAAADAWWTEFSGSDRSPTTKRVYRDRLDGQIISGLGDVRCRDLSVGVAERFLRAVQDRHGPSLTRIVRSVLSNVCQYAVRHDAMIRNPVPATSTISVNRQRAATALTVDQVRQLRAFLSYDRRAVARDLPAVVGVLAATGMRIGEALALVWDAVDLGHGTVDVRGTVVRIKGRGLIIRSRPKTDAGYRTLILPTWCRTELDTRRTAPGRDWGGLALVFPSAVGTLRDPSTVAHQLKDAFAAAGRPDLTSHVFRRTVATLMDQAGLSARAGADQLGHAHVSMTQDTYWARKLTDTGAASVLDTLR